MDRITEVELKIQRKRLSIQKDMKSQSVTVQIIVPVSHSVPGYQKVLLLCFLPFP